MEQRASKHRHFSAPFKHNLVTACEQTGASIAAIALNNGLNTNLLHRWIREHKRGKDWAKPRRTYPEELKQIVIEQSLAPGALANEIARSHGLYPELVRGWIKKAQTEQSTTRTPTSSPPRWLAVLEQPPAVAQKPVAAHPCAPETGQIDIELGGARLQLRGAVDLETLRLVLASLR